MLSLNVRLDQRNCVCHERTLRKANVQTRKSWSHHSERVLLKMFVSFRVRVFDWLQMITFQFKCFRMVPANSGEVSLSLEDVEALFFYACLHNSYLSWCWTDV